MNERGEEEDNDQVWPCRSYGTLLEGYRRFHSDQTEEY